MISKTILVEQMYRDKMSDIKNVANTFEELILEVKD